MATVIKINIDEQDYIRLIERLQAIAALSTAGKKSQHGIECALFDQISHCNDSITYLLTQAGKEREDD